jgi:deazaflavin-dependent oxidoreductase (nitroreductase family)
MSAADDTVIVEFRANHGIVTEAMGGHFKNTTVALVHHVGRRTGQERVTPLLCMADGENHVLVGSNGGATGEPLWVSNLEAMASTSIELGDRVLTVKPTVLRDGPERERIYRKVTEFWPDMLSYETKTDRPFAVIVLEPRNPE